MQPKEPSPEGRSTEISVDGIDNISPVHISALKSVYKYLGGGDVGSHGDVVNIAKTEKVGIVRLKIALGERIAEKEQKIYFIAADTGGYLLVAALSSAEIFVYIVYNHFAFLYNIYRQILLTQQQE